MSFGGGRLSAGEMRALRYALRKDVVLIAAAADSPIAEQGHPAKDLQPTGTGRKHQRRARAWSSRPRMPRARARRSRAADRRSRWRRWATPGTRGGGIFSTFPAQRRPRSRRAAPTRRRRRARPAAPIFNGDPRFAYLAGTSMAAPQVAGAVALVRAANPRLRRIAVVRLMKQTATRAPGRRMDHRARLGNPERRRRGAAGGRSWRPGHRAAEDQPPRRPQPQRVGRGFTLRVAGARPGAAGRPAGRHRVLLGLRASAAGRDKLIATTTGNRYRYRGRRGKRYRFFVRARDLAGNVEPTRRASFVVRVRR